MRHYSPYSAAMAIPLKGEIEMNIKLRITPYMTTFLEVFRLAPL